MGQIEDSTAGVAEQNASGHEQVARGSRHAAAPGRANAEVRAAQFSELQNTPASAPAASIERVMGVSVLVSVELGRAQVTLQELMSLAVGSVLELSKKAGEPVDLVLNGRVLAQGEVVVVDENFGIRITRIEEPQVRFNSLT